MKLLAATLGLIAATAAANAEEIDTSKPVKKLARAMIGLLGG